MCGGAELRTVSLVIKGRVQGVGFRAWTRSKAEALGLTGWVKNIPSGDVEAEYQGDEGALSELIEALHYGPDAARVSEVKVTYLTDDRA
ncbi:MAG: acylphosphatase [Proteobacteria bacterium]|nr:MAG: acylphosphatase [Pseudomonadota bacterium]